MANLRIHKKKGNYNEELKQQIKNDLKVVDANISELNAKKMELKKDLLELAIEPFKIGEYALAEITSGRTKKWQKCLLENIDGVLYLRPVKEDGNLSGRHFSLIPINDNYSAFLKEVK